MPIRLVGTLDTVTQAWNNHISLWAWSPLRPCSREDDLRATQTREGAAAVLAVAAHTAVASWPVQALSVRHLLGGYAAFRIIDLVIGLVRLGLFGSIRTDRFIGELSSERLQRLLILTAISMAELVALFAFLYLFISARSGGAAFSPPLDGRGNALLVSISAIVTVGYGAFRPVTPDAILIVGFEGVVAVVMLSVVVATLVSIRDRAGTTELIEVTPLSNPAMREVLFWFPFAMAGLAAWMTLATGSIVCALIWPVVASLAIAFAVGLRSKNAEDDEVRGVAHQIWIEDHEPLWQQDRHWQLAKRRLDNRVWEFVEAHPTAAGRSITIVFGLLGVVLALAIVIEAWLQPQAFMPFLWRLLAVFSSTLVMAAGIGLVVRDGPLPSSAVWIPRNGSLRHLYVLLFIGALIAAWSLL